MFGLVMLPETRGKTLAQVRERIRVMMMMVMMMICIQINRMFYTDPLLNLARVRALVAGLGRGGGEEERHRNIYTPTTPSGGTSWATPPAGTRTGQTRWSNPVPTSPTQKQ